MDDKENLLLWREIYALRSRCEKLEKNAFEKPSVIPIPEPNVWMGFDETARFLQISKNTLRKLMRLKKIFFFQDERKILFKKSDLEKYLNSFYNNPHPED